VRKRVFDLRPLARVLLVAPFLLIRQGMIALAFVQNAVVDPFRARRSLVLFVGVSFIAKVCLFITAEELLLTIMDVRGGESLFANELAADIEADVALVDRRIGTGRVTLISRSTSPRALPEPAVRLSPQRALPMPTFLPRPYGPGRNLPPISPFRWLIPNHHAPTSRSLQLPFSEQGVGILPPFPLYAAFPHSEYYGGSATRAARRRTALLGITARASRLQ
jgi:hypothetical protein